MTTHIKFRAEFFKEEAMYVGLSPELNVSSFGETLDEAKQSLQDAVEAFLEECDNMGTLREVLEEAGFYQEGKTWIARQPVVAEVLSVG